MSEATPDDSIYVDDRVLERRTPLVRSQWQTYRRNGGGPKFYKVGRRCLYKWAEVVAWLESQAVTK